MDILLSFNELSLDENEIIFIIIIDKLSKLIETLLYIRVIVGTHGEHCDSVL